MTWPDVQTIRDELQRIRLDGTGDKQLLYRLEQAESPALQRAQDDWADAHGRPREAILPGRAYAEAIEADPRVRAVVAGLTPTDRQMIDPGSPAGRRARRASTVPLTDDELQQLADEALAS